eukprot:617696-Prorocentrum_minimum.AAC.3
MNCPSDLVSKFRLIEVTRALYLSLWGIKAKLILKTTNQLLQHVAEYAQIVVLQSQHTVFNHLKVLRSFEWQVHERKVARKAALERLKAPVVDVRAVLRLEESEYEHELKHKDLEGEDPRQPLRELIAAVLLETKGDFDPIDTQGLHRKLSAAGTERQYKATLEKAGLKDFEPVLVEMAEGSEPYIELEELTITNKTRLMVMDIHRPRLLRCWASPSHNTAMIRIVIGITYHGTS